MKKKIIPFPTLAFPSFQNKKGFQGKGKSFSFLILFLVFSACAVKHEGGNVPDTDTPSNSPYYYYLESRNRLRQERPLEALGFLRHAVALDPESAFLHQELTAVLVGTGQIQAALQSIEKAEELDPDNPQTLLALAGIKQMLGHDIREIIPVYERVIQLDPEQENIYLLLGNLYFSEKKPEKAEAVYRKFIARNPDKANGYYYLGQLMSLLGRNREALSNFDKAIEKAPDLLEPRMDRLKVFRRELNESLKVSVRPGDTVNGLLRTHLGKTSPALREQLLALNPLLKNTDHLENNTHLILPPSKKNPLVKKIRKAYADLIEKNPYSSELIMESALFLWKTGETEAAKKRLLPLIKEEENRDNSLSMIHALLEKGQNYRDAIFLLESMAEESPGDSLFLYHMGLVYDDAGMEREAREIYERVPVGDPVYVSILKHLAHMDFRTGAMETGVARLETAWNLDRTDLVTCSFLSGVYAGEEKLREAETLLHTCLELNPGHRENRYRLGVVLHKQGKIDDSIREMETLLLDFPEDAHALNFLGYTLTEENKRLDEAEVMIRKAAELEPEDGYIIDSMGWICMKRGKLAEALFYLEKAVKLIPDDAVIWDHLGDVYRKVGEMEMARDAYKKSISLKEDPLVMKKIEELPQKSGAISLP